MKKKTKRLAIFLSILLVAPTVLGCLPQNTLQAEAASNAYLNWTYEIKSTYNYDSEGILTLKRELQAEKGMKFNLGDLIHVSYKDKYGYLSDYSGVKYESSNKKVASISKNGEVSVVGTGTTEFKVTFKGTTTQCTLKAVKSGAFGSKKASNVKAAKAANTLCSKGKTITSKNRYAVYQANGKLDQILDNMKNLTYRGFLKEKRNSYYETTNKLVVPELLKTRKVESRLTEYTCKNNPVGTTSSKWFKISKVSPKKNSKTFTITLKSKVTDTQIFAIKSYYSSDSYIANDKIARFPIYVVDKKTGHKYRGTAVAKKGSKTLQVTMDYLKLKKNTNYQLVGIEKDYKTGKSWTKNKTFKVK